MAVDNTKIDDHITPGNKYLVKIDNGPQGNYRAESFDPQNIGTIEAQVTGDGNYSVGMYDANGNFSHTVHGGEKKAVDSHTHTVSQNADIAIGGGVRHNIGSGEFKSIGTGSSYAAVDGPAVNVTAENMKNISAGGDGHHAVSGDQSFTVANGGIHNSVDQDYTVTALGVVHVASGSEYSVQVGGNEGHTSNGSTSFWTGNSFTVNAISSINITSIANITFQVGSSMIVMTPNSILISSANVFVSSTTSNGITLSALALNANVNINANLFVNVQGGGSTSSPTSFT